MKPFVIEPQAGELKACVAYVGSALGEDCEEKIAVVGGDEFMVRLFSDFLQDIRQLGEVQFQPGKLYTWKGFVCVHQNQLFKAHGAWTSTEWFTPRFSWSNDEETMD